MTKASKSIAFQRKLPFYIEKCNKAWTLVSRSWFVHYCKCTEEHFMKWAEQTQTTRDNYSMIMNTLKVEVINAPTNGICNPAQSKLILEEEFWFWKTEVDEGLVILERDLVDW